MGVGEACHDRYPSYRSVACFDGDVDQVYAIRPDDGIAVGDLQRRAALNGKEPKVWLTRMGKWWGYIAVDRIASDNPLDWIVRPTAGGKKGYG